MIEYDRVVEIIPSWSVAKATASVATPSTTATPNCFDGNSGDIHCNWWRTRSVFKNWTPWDFIWTRYEHNLQSTNTWYGSSAECCVVSKKWVAVLYLFARLQLPCNKYIQQVTLLVNNFTCSNYLKSNIWSILRGKVGLNNVLKAQNSTFLYDVNSLSSSTKLYMTQVVMFSGYNMTHNKTR